MLGSAAASGNRMAGWRGTATLGSAVGPISALQVYRTRSVFASENIAPAGTRPYDERNTPAALPRREGERPMAEDTTTPPVEWLDGPTPAGAPPETQQFYRTVGEHLRIPFLGSFWRAIAWQPQSAATLWPALQPLLRSRAFERAAADLRGAALIEEAATMPSHQAFKADLVRAEIDSDMREKIGNFSAGAYYALGKSLLAATWLRLALDGAVTPGPVSGDSIPVGVAAGFFPVPPVTPNETRGRLAELLAEIPRAHGHPLADDYFKSIGRAVDYLNAAWNALTPIVRDEPYDERAALVARQAGEAAANLPAGEIDALSRLDDETRARLRAVAAYYSERHLPDLLIDVAIIKALTDGPERARDAPYDLPDT